MKPCNFEYMKCFTISDVTQMLNEFGNKAQILAGGQSLISMMNMRIVNPEILIDINFLKDIISIEEKEDTILRTLQVYSWVGFLWHRAYSPHWWSCQERYFDFASTYRCWYFI